LVYLSCLSDAQQLFGLVLVRDELGVRARYFTEHVTGTLEWDKLPADTAEDGRNVAFNFSSWRGSFDRLAV